MTTASRSADPLHHRREAVDHVPVIDIGPLVRGHSPAGPAAAIRTALETIGFFYVTHHGVPAALIEAAFAQTKRFFDQPTEAKAALDIRRSGLALRGYTDPSGEATAPGEAVDLKECFDLGPETPDRETPFFGANPWPALPGFRETLSAYHDAGRSLATSLMRGIAVSLDLAPDHFDPVLADAISIQRLLHYPPTPAPETMKPAAEKQTAEKPTLGAGAHTDYGLLTLLAQDDVGGLQVRNRDGVWIDAPPLPGSFIVNIGDILQRLTNDRYLANVHRVVNRSGRERYSLPLFFDAAFDTVFEPLPGCIGPDNPRRHGRIHCGRHKLARYRASYPHLDALLAGRN